MNTPFLYPAIEPYSVQRLKVSSVHELYIEECGNPNGHPVIFIHGGPGGGVGPDDRRYFNPKEYRIILFDQRGAGKSTPAADLTDNTTWHLVEDIETIRMHLKIKKWLVFGGSWGSTLALTYAIQHPSTVVGLVLRGIFMIRKKEIDWFYQSGADAIFPDVWESYQNAIPEAERQDYVRAYYSRLTSPDLKIQMLAAKAWTTWEIATSRLYTPPELIAQTVTDDFVIKFARIECHYFINRGFYPVDDWILKNIQNIKSIPMFIAQGRYDVVCPMTSAWDLHRALPAAELRIIADAGHSSREPGIARALTEATDRFIQYFR